MGFWDWLMGTPPQQRDMPANKKLPAARRTSLLHLQVGDVASYDGIDYMVKNKVTYEDEGFVWYDYLLADESTDNELWLSVEDDDGLQVGIYHEVELDSMPPVPRGVTLDGIAYKQCEHSNAGVTVERDDPTRSTHSSVEYWEYEAPGGHYLTVTRWGGEYEASAGQAIKEYQVKVYPASS